MSGGRLRFARFIASAFLIFLAVTAEAEKWSDYQVIMWQKQSLEGYRRLRSIGFTAAMLRGNRDQPGLLDESDLRPLIDSGMRPYVENIATDFYSAYHRFFPDRPPNWRFLAVRNLYRTDPHDATTLTRDPSLSDPKWLDKIAHRINDTVEANRRYDPLFYNLADEPGIADLGAFWDFDFSETSLIAMRQWLESKYLTLEALNAEWGTNFATWDAILPITTSEAIHRAGENFAPWADFKAWMDVAFSRAFTVGRDAVHAADPNALAGMEGGQKPGWGGYDYTKLVGSVDVMETEPELFQLAHALNPRLHLLMTSFGDAIEGHRVWRGLLDGGSGVIVWDAKRQFLTPEGALGERGRAIAPVLSELRGGIGALILNSEPISDNVAILYSPQSLRVQWLLDWKDRNDAWLTRGAGAEDRDDNTVRNAIDGFTRGFEKLGFAPTFLSPEMIEHGALSRGIRVLALPHAIALSSQSTAAILDFINAGGTVIADAMPGTFDDHGKKLSSAQLRSLFKHGKAFLLAPGQLRRNQDADPPRDVDHRFLSRLGETLREQKIEPVVRLISEDAGSDVTNVLVRRYRNGSVELVALLLDTPAGVLKELTVQMPKRGYLYDARHGTFLRRDSIVHLSLDDQSPAVLAISPNPLPGPTVTAEPSIRVGGELSLTVGISEIPDAAAHVLHLVLSEAGGDHRVGSAENIVLRENQAEIKVPVPNDATPGQWDIEVTDVLSGQKAHATTEIIPRRP